MRRGRTSKLKTAPKAEADDDAAKVAPSVESDAYQPKATRRHRRDTDGVQIACSAKDFPVPDLPSETAKGPVPRLEPDILLEVSDVGSEPGDDARRERSAVVRAVVRAELPAGTVSIQDELAKRYRWLGEAQVFVRPVRDFAECATVYELEHLELSFRDQFVSRSDMLEVNMAVANRPLFVGQEVYVTGFTFTVNRMIRRAQPAEPDAAEPLPLAKDAHAGSVTDLPALLTPVRGEDERRGRGEEREAPQRAGPSSSLHQECDNGLVTARTHVSFESLTYVTTCLFCVSSELDTIMVDGRTAFDWALDGLVRDYVRRLTDEYEAAPLLRVVLFGVAAHADTARETFITTACVARAASELRDLPRELKRQVMLFRRRALERCCISAEGFSFFAPAGHSNFLDAINVTLERFGKHGVNRRLNYTGHSLFVVTAGRGIFCVPDVSAAELTARRVHDIGIKTCTVICAGRPPLHHAPLFEFEGTDQALASQRNLRIDRRRLYYSQPKWITCLYYYAARVSGFNASPSFDLYTRAQWYERFGHGIGKHGSLAFPQMGNPPVPYAFADGTRMNDGVESPPVDRANHYSRERFLHSNRSGDFNIGRGSSGVSNPLQSPPPSSFPTFTGTSHEHQRRSAHDGTPSAMFDTAGAGYQTMGPPECAVNTAWLGPSDEGDEAQELISLLDQDLAHYQLSLVMRINHRAFGDAAPLWWNPAIATDDDLWKKFLDCFRTRFTKGAFESRKHDFIVPPRQRSFAGEQLVLETAPVADITVTSEEEILFDPVPELFIDSATNQPLRSFPCMAFNAVLRSPVCTLSPLWATVFAFQPAHPYTGAAERSSRCDELMTNAAMSNRWAYRFPSRTRSRDRANWDTLCRCPLMPLRCPRDTVITNQLSFINVPYDRVYDRDAAPLIFMEMVYQRLSQDFQLVTLGDNEALLTMGHQTHNITLFPDTGQIQVEASQHRGVWCTAERVRKVRFLKWNYLAKNFEEVQGELGSQIGVGHQVVSWHKFDDEVLRRSRQLDFEAPTRNIGYAMLPADPSQPMQADKLFEFLDGRFSTMLQRATEDEVIPYFRDASDGGVERRSASFAEPPASALSIGGAVQQLSTFSSTPLDGRIPVALDEPVPTTLIDGCPVPVHNVQLVTPPGASEKIVTLHRRRFNPVANCVEPPQLCRERGMFVNVYLSDVFDPRCCFTVRASWTICTGSVLADWDNHIRLVAPDFGFNVVRIPRTRFDALGSLDFLPSLTIEYHAMPSGREAVIDHLCRVQHYYPERLPIVRGTRLVHYTGLVIIVSDEQGLVFGENSMVGNGTKEQHELYQAFLIACRRPLPPSAHGASDTATSREGSTTVHASSRNLSVAGSPVDLAQPRDQRSAVTSPSIAGTQPPSLAASVPQF